MTAQTLPGIPEPGLLLYGSVSNSSAGSILTSATINWTITGNSSTSGVPATIISVNGQYFYLAKIPFETRQLGAITFGATSNVLAFAAAGATYARSATANGASAAIAASSLGRLGTFSFGARDRGTVERVDLKVNLATNTFAQWALRYFGATNVDPNADPDGDGMTNYQEYLAGTNPLDPQSKLALYEVHPDPRGGLAISWQTIPGQTYAVFRSADLNQGFTRLQGTLSATAATTSFYDATANGFGPYFYRVGVEAGHP